MKIASITDPDTAAGLKLAGIEEVHEIERSKEAEEILEKLAEEKEVRIIIITESLAQKIGEKIDEFKEERGRITPVLIEIPSKEGPIPERREKIDKVVKRAVGIEVER